MKSVLSDKASNCSISDHYFGGKHSAVMRIGAGNKLLRNYAGQYHRQLHSDLILLVGRERVDNSVDCVYGSGGMHCRKHQVTRFCRGKRGTYTFKVSHFAQNYNVGVLSQYRFKRSGKGRSIVVDFSLSYETLFAVEYEFYRVFDSDNMSASMSVDIIEHRRKRRRLTATMHFSTLSGSIIMNSLLAIKASCSA